ncbi:hypothetical protein GWI72_08765 [Microvirga tunisiensis]|uniref:Uncharacterized protein n=2 Tax=Pannonibacter tanglangensis TaxID=2750084 RepID=A0A7X5F253_9HYPH|nr:MULTISPECIES: DUF6447 family protein [unclassified Pannonibacter]NBN62701.1 hypothetical protein [Pannonibacter sp. XCT-34]NBN78356.1 hypothetical protein [Pannonibacter sp. XCT-53]
MSASDNTVTIDGKVYQLSALSAEAQNQLRNLQEVDRKIAMAKNEIETMTTWRTIHSHALKVELDKMA